MIYFRKMKRIKFFFTLIALLSLSACKTKTGSTKPPKDVLDNEQMIAVLVDIHLAESYGYMERITHIEKTALLTREYGKVLKTHNLSLEKLQKSYDWYMNHPVIFDEMYDKVIEQIKIQEQFAQDEDSDKEEKLKEKNPINKIKNEDLADSSVNVPIALPTNNKPE